MSWWLGRDTQVENSELLQGIQEHTLLSSNLDSIQTKERRSTELRLSFLISTAMVINLIAVILVGISDLPSGDKTSLLFSTSLVWIAIGGLLLYIPFRKRRWGPYTFAEGASMVLSTLMMLVALNTIFLLQIDFIVGGMYLVLAVLWFIITLAILFLHHFLTGEILGLRKREGVSGDLVYIGEKGNVLRSKTHGLSGSPDLVMRRGEEMIPVEVKTGRVPKGPLFSHLLQLGTYCVIISDICGRRVERGLLRYGQKDFEIEFDENLEQLVLIKAEEMRAILREGGAHRNHNRPNKCRNCSRRAICPESLL